MKTPRPRRSLAPFVGVALAALTIGSLVTFSLVAQRTSLEGFTTRGVVVAAPPAASPPSIVLPGTNTTSPRADEGPTHAEPAPLAAGLLVVQPVDEQASVTGALAAAESSGEAGDLLPSRDGSFLELPGGPVNASRSDGGAGSADDAEGKAKKVKKPKRAKSPKPRAAVPQQSRGRPDDAGPPSEPKPSRPAPKPTPVAKGHDKARGEGHAKDRGRGHHKH